MHICLKMVRSEDTDRVNRLSQGPCVHLQGGPTVLYVGGSSDDYSNVGPEVGSLFQLCGVHRLHDPQRRMTGRLPQASIARTRTGHLGQVVWDLRVIPLVLVEASVLASWLRRLRPVATSQLEPSGPVLTPCTWASGSVVPLRFGSALPVR